MYTRLARQNTVGVLESVMGGECVVGLMGPYAAAYMCGLTSPLARVARVGCIHAVRQV